MHTGRRGIYVALTDIAQVLMVWEPDDLDGAILRVTHSIESFGAACNRSELTGTVVIVDGAFDAAVQGSELPINSPDEVIAEAREMCAHYGLLFVDASVRIGGAWPAESTKLTHALRAASLYAPAIIRLDSDETLDDSSDLGAAVEAMRDHHGAVVIWDTVGKQVHGSQPVAKKPHLRMFAANRTLTAGPAYHGSYKVFEGEWLALRMMGDENGGLERARIANAANIVTITNHPAERSAAMHDAKSRLFHHRYKGAYSDR